MIVPNKQGIPGYTLRSFAQLIDVAVAGWLACEPCALLPAAGMPTCAIIRGRGAQANKILRYTLGTLPLTRHFFLKEARHWGGGVTKTK